MKTERKWSRRSLKERKEMLAKQLCVACHYWDNDPEANACVGCKDKSNYKPRRL
jgi:hypothetical protein